MCKLKFKYLSVVAILLIAVSVQASEFGWLDALSLEARADESGFRTRLATRFHIGDVKVRAVIGDVGGHADAYMVLRLAEMSHMPVERVIEHYHDHKGRGWGVLAKSLGIKPGSREFHALKRGHDMHGSDEMHGGKGKNKGKNGKGKKDKGDKGKGHGKNR